MIIGLTGGIGTGKSESVKYFMKYGAEIIDCDIIARECSELKEIRAKIKEKYGKDVVKGEKIDRKKLKEIVFEDKEKLKQLNEIMHPEILKRVRNKIIENSEKNLIVVDMPLLFEVGFEKEVDKIVLINAPFEVQIERVISRDSLNYDEAIKIIKTQMSMAEKIKKSDYIIDNSGSKKELGEKIFNLINKIK
jgi:dephospho-CoA kinase